MYSINSNKQKIKKIKFSVSISNRISPFLNGSDNIVLYKRPGARFTNVLSAKKFVSSFLRTVCVSQTQSTYEFLKDFAKIFLNIVVTLRQGGGDLIFQKMS